MKKYILSLAFLACIFLGSSMAQTTWDPNVDPSLVGWWQLNSGTTAIDSSSHANTGTEMGAPSFVAGGALDFNGTSQYVSIPNSASLQVGSNFTVAAWIYPKNFSLGGNGRYSIFSTQSNNDAGSWQLQVGQVTNVSSAVNANTIAVTGPNPGYADTLINCGATDSISTNAWQHVVYVHPSGTGVGTLYINGVAIPSNSNCNTTYTIADNNSPKLIGLGTSGPNRFFPGCLGDVRIYNQALNASQVSAIYANGASISTSTCGVSTPNTYYVSTSGNDSNSGTSAAAPWATLAKAASMATNPGDTVNISGTFSSEPLRINNSGTASAPITFKGKDALLTYPDINTGGSPIINAVGQYIVLDGLKVTLPDDPWHYNTAVTGFILRNYDIAQNCELYGVQGDPSRSNTVDTFVGFDLHGDYGIVRNSYIHDNDNIDISRVAGSFNDFMNNTLIYNNDTCYACVPNPADSNAEGQHADLMQAITWVSGVNVNSNIIENNTAISNNISGGMYQCEEDSSGNCIPSESNGFIIRNNVFDNRMSWEQIYLPYMEVYNNVFYNDCGSAPIFFYAKQGYGAQIYNNVFIGCGVHDENGSYGGGNTKEYNAFDAEALTHDTDQSYDSTSIIFPETSANALFVNPAAGDFHLQATSALIGKGTNLSTITNPFSGLASPSTTDMEGHARPSTGVWDIGPYEYTGSSPANYTITYSAGSNGLISTPGASPISLGSVTVVSGKNQPFIITPAAGYQVSSISVDGNFDPNFNQVMFTYTLGYVTTYMLSNVTANHTIAVNFGPISTGGTSPNYSLTVGFAPGGAGGTITSSPAGINCVTLYPTTCIASFNSGTLVTLTATANSGYIFSGWLGAGAGACSGTGTCTVTMNAAQSITANFTYPYRLNVSSAGNGKGAISSSDGNINCGSNCSEMVNGGTNVTLTAMAASGSVFAGWSISDNPYGSPAGPCPGPSNLSCITVTVNNATTVTANFNTLGSVPPSITTQPVNATVALGSTAIFTVSATGTAPLSYEWYASPDGGTTWEDAGDTNTHTTLPTTTAYNGYEYKCVVSNGVYPPATSNVAILTVNSTGVLLGDVNGDGRVNILDAELTAEAAIGVSVPNFNATAAQVDGTGKLSITDAELIAQFSVKAIKKFPVQGG